MQAEVNGLLRPVWFLQSRLLLDECERLVATQLHVDATIRYHAALRLSRHLCECAEGLGHETLSQGAALMCDSFRLGASDASKISPPVADGICQMTRMLKVALDSSDHEPSWDAARDVIGEFQRQMGTMRSEATGGVDDIGIDAVFRTVSRPNVGRTILTGKEVQLMSLLKDAPGNVLNRDDLLKQVWGGSGGAGKVFGVHLLNLRRKISPLGLSIRFIAPNQYRLAIEAN